MRWVSVSVRYLPGWLPGMGFKQKSRGWSKTVASFYDTPYAFVQRQRVSMSVELFCKDAHILINVGRGKAHRFLHI